MNAEGGHDMNTVSTVDSNRADDEAHGFSLAVAQFAPGPSERTNLERMRALAGSASARGAGLVVFPEYSSFFELPLGESFVAAAQTLDGSFVSSLSDLARTLNIFVVAGLVERVDASARFSNTLVAISPDGELVATYRKQHLYDAFGSRESDWVIAGPLEPPQTFRVAGMTVGSQTCYDIRFTEVTRRLVDAGADLVLVPSEWARGPLKERHWATLLSARAIENTIYVAASDQTAPGGVGASMVVYPMGVASAQLGEREDVAVAWISPERIRQVRGINPSLILRRYKVEPG